MALGSKNRKQTADVPVPEFSHSDWEVTEPAPEEAPSEPVSNGNGLSVDALVVEDSDADFGYERKPQDKPLIDALVRHIQASWDADGKGKSVPVSSKEEAKKMTALIRRAGNEKILSDQGIGVRLKEEVNESGVGKIHFRAKPKTVRKYTTADVRNYFGLAADATVSKEQRAEYKKAHNL